MNVEPLRQQLADDGFGARLAASVSSYAGNTQGVIFGASALLGGRSQRNLVYAMLSGDYASLNGVVSVAKWFAHARHNYNIRRWLAWEEFGQLESDRFRRVQLRELLGTGPRFTLLHSDAVKLYAGTSYMFEHTESDTDDPESPGQGSFHRWNNYVSITLAADERILLSTVGYFQPRFDEPSDHHVLSVTSAGFKVTDRLQSRIDCTVRYESVHPSEAEGADIELKSSLELVF